MTVFSLHPFPGQDPEGVSIQGALERTPQALQLAFLLQGDLADLVLPPETGRKRCDNLWQATCFEMFWAEEGRKNYWELNLAPNGAWNVYRFTDYRRGMRQADLSGPVAKIRQTADSFALAAELEIGNLHAVNTPLRVGISAVLLHQDTRLSHWSLAHPEARPDFHAPKSLLLRM